jgi:hypothetical protein
MSNIVRFDAWRTIAFTSIGASYAPLGTRLGHAMRVLHFVNNTDGDVAISFDGITDNVFVPSDSFSVYDLTSDQDSTESFRYEVGTQLYIKYMSAPTSGSFYCMAIYGKGE